MIKQSSNSTFDFKAETDMQFLPRCAACEAPHPLARKPKMPADHCPDCGAESAFPIHQSADAVFSLSGIVGMIAAALLRAGEAIRKLAKRI